MLVFSVISLVLGAANIQGSDVDSAASGCRDVSRQMDMGLFHNTYYLIYVETKGNLITHEKKRLFRRLFLFVSECPLERDQALPRV